MTSIDWTQILVAAITVAGGIMVASVPFVVPILVAKRRREIRERRKREESRKLISDIHESTVNTHTTILREDVDSLIEKTERLDTKLDKIMDLVLDQTTQARSINGKVTSQAKTLREHSAQLASLSKLVTGEKAS